VNYYSILIACTSHMLFLIELIKKYVFLICLKKHISFLYVGYIKFSTNQFVRNFYLLFIYLFYSCNPSTIVKHAFLSYLVTFEILEP
jgi:hypothetical protein